MRCEGFSFGGAKLFQMEFVRRASQTPQNGHRALAPHASLLVLQRINVQEPPAGLEQPTDDARRKGLGGVIERLLAVVEHLERLAQGDGRACAGQGRVGWHVSEEVGENTQTPKYPKTQPDFPLGYLGVWVFRYLLKRPHGSSEIHCIRFSREDGLQRRRRHGIAHCADRARLVHR